MLKTTALCAVGFMLLASGRALVPNACATQRALASCHEVAEPAKVQGCCEDENPSAILSTGDVPHHVSDDSVHCGLCVLATALVLALELGGYVDAGARTTMLAVRTVSEPALPILWTPTLPRDPPATA